MIRKITLLWLLSIIDWCYNLVFWNSLFWLNSFIKLLKMHLTWAPIEGLDNFFRVGKGRGERVEFWRFMFNKIRHYEIIK